MNPAADKQRLDKWLWAARFYKTRSLAQEEIAKGRVHVNGEAAKAARELKPGDTVALRQGELTRTVVVHGLSQQRGPAAQAQLLYEETPESRQRRELLCEQKRYNAEPAHAIQGGRPTKAGRRALQNLSWDKRWSARLGD